MLTKKRFVTAMTCPKYAYLSTEHPLDEEMSRLSLEGIEVGELARHLFENVTYIEWREDQGEMLFATEKALKDAKVIAEAAFAWEDLYCRVDYLEVCPDGVIIHEVKAKTHVEKRHETKARGVFYEGFLDELLWDVAFQYYVVTKCGFHVKQVNLVHLNHEYRRHGEINYQKLFTTYDATEDVLAFDIESAIDIARRAYTEDPGDLIRHGCPKCGYWDICGEHLPENNVFTISDAGLRWNAKGKQYEQGVWTYEELLESGTLSPNGEMEVRGELFGESSESLGDIKEFLQSITYPLFFLDFETFDTAVPMFDNQWPYEKIPFQYSLDIIREPGGDIEHFEYLGETEEDPRQEIAETLVKLIPKGACVTAYNMTFERDRLMELAELFPPLAERLKGIAESLVDFFVPFQKRYYYLPAMKGSASIKAVLPALFPGDESLNYKKLPGVQVGTEATDTYLKLPIMGERERTKQRAYLLRYCGLDTFAMIKVYEALLKVVGDPLYKEVERAANEYAVKRDAKYAEEDIELGKL